MPPRYNFFDYLKLAFRRWVPVPGLGPMPVNQMALGVFAVLGIPSPGFWFLGAALELLYLFGVASNPRFQKLVQGEQLLAEQRVWEDRIQQTARQLEPQARERYRRLLAQCRRILGISEALAADSLGDFRDLRARSLNQLLGIFLRLLTSQQVIDDNTQHLSRDQLAAEIAQLEARLAAGGGDEVLTRSLQGTLAIQRRRLENFDRATASLQVIGAELERIEQQVELIREEAAVGGKPELLSDRLDAVTSHMSETSRWMDEQAQLFGNLSAEDGGGVLASLPALPEIPEKE